MCAYLRDYHDYTYSYTYERNSSHDRSCEYASRCMYAHKRT